MLLGRISKSSFLPTSKNPAAGWVFLFVFEVEEIYFQQKSKGNISEKCFKRRDFRKGRIYKIHKQLQIILS
jgi:hypothetical protein